MTHFDNRPALARFVFLASTVLVLAYSALWLYRYASIATDENLYDDINGRVTIISITPDGASDRAGLMVGDSIIAINGNPVGNKFEANRYLIEGSGGNVLRYTIVREGETRELPVVVAEFGLPLQYLAAILTALFLLALAAFVFVRRTSHRVARLFGWANLVFGFALLVHRSISVYHYPDALTAVAMYMHPLLWPTAVALYLHLLLDFPVARYVRPVPLQLMTALYVIPYTVFIVLLLLPAMLGIKGMYSILLPVFGLIASVFVLQYLFRRRMKNLEATDYRTRSRPVHILLIVTMLFIVLLLLVPLTSYWQFVSMIGVLIPAGLFLVIARQRLFDLYIVLRRRSLYSVLHVALSAVTAFLLAASLVLVPRQQLDLPVLNVTGGQVEVLRLSSLSQDRRAVFERRLTFVAGALLLAVLYWLYRSGRKVLDQRFYRGSLDYKHALTTFSNLSHSHMDTLALGREAVSGVVKLLHVRGAAFALRSSAGFVAHVAHHLRLKDDALDFDDATMEILKTAFEKSPVVATDNLSIRERFDELGVEFLVGVQIEQHLEILLLLSEKESDTNYSREDVELLENLAINLADALLTMRFYDSAREKERLRKELEIARHIQMQSLPTVLPEFPGIDVAAESIPAYEVGGDFYDVLPRHDSAMFVVGDVSGKGTSAAMYLARLQGILKTIESFQPTPWELFTRLNTLIFDHIERKSFVTLAALKIDFLSSDVRFLRAGHLPLVHYNALAREASLYQPAGMAIGLDPHGFPEILAEEVIFSRAGDVFVLVSDGVTEAANAEGTHFGIEGVMDCVVANATGSAEEIQCAIISAVSRYCTTEQEDDMTVLVVKCSIRSDG
ncbi:MAG: SpoIIE family protein phosphatase [Bacteroidia bacterium]|nr:SpoIIE family protein phosphatase [Bacteroidia bacterium]